VRLGPRVLVCQTVPGVTELALGIVFEPDWARSSWSEPAGCWLSCWPTAVAPPPVSAKLAADTVAGLRVSKLLAGVSGRGQPTSTR
jgi:hypothetical protein